MHMASIHGYSKQNVILKQYCANVPHFKFMNRAPINSPCLEFQRFAVADPLLQVNAVKNYDKKYFAACSTSSLRDHNFWHVNKSMEDILQLVGIVTLEPLLRTSLKLHSVKMSHSQYNIFQAVLSLLRQHLIPQKCCWVRTSSISLAISQS